MALRLTTPEGVDFADLYPSRSPVDGPLVFDRASIKAICEAAALTSTKSWAVRSCSLPSSPAGWYAARLQRGRKPDPVQGEFLEMARLEMKRGA